MKSWIVASLAVIVTTGAMLAIATPADAYYYHHHYYRYHWHRHYYGHRHCYHGPYRCRYW
jgi:hypothetical protein